MQNIIEGRVWKFGDNVDTEVICPGAYIHLPPKDILPYAFKAIRPNFHLVVREGDVIVAGKNFGVGSSRECAASVIKEMGINALLVESVGRIFFRNCIALGIPVIVQKGITHYFDEGDHVRIELESGKILNTTTGNELKVPSLPHSLLQIIQNGGLRPLINEILKNRV